MTALQDRQVDDTIIEALTESVPDDMPLVAYDSGEWNVDGDSLDKVATALRLLSGSRP